MIHLIGMSTDRTITIEDGNSALAFGDIDSNSNHSKPPFEIDLTGYSTSRFRHIL